MQSQDCRPSAAAAGPGSVQVAGRSLGRGAPTPHGAGFPLPSRSAIGTYAPPSRGAGSLPVIV